ncbi:LAMI_0A07558g1_1 [Lachancea mirantina]|uniref:LAMI_0A07558g1_1 n=1 Tax=Lachancea mirantina TaxID=1230905 RepID=A0A1G4IR04_9SACH|nr:LAMI_0A07558g1_1 [Lachancea mirantina]
MGFLEHRTSNNEGGAWHRLLDSFKPAQTVPADPTAMVSRETGVTSEKGVDDALSITDVERSVANSGGEKTGAPDESQYRADLSVRHLLTLAVGGAIGTGLFVNSGSALTTGGPASLVIDWVIISTCLFTIVNALGELSSTFPVVGGFNVYNSRFVEPSFGFAVNVNYLAQWAVLLPLELVAASITIRYWNSSINSDAWVAIFYTAIFLANLLDVKSFGETEFVLSMVKILAILGFTILGIVLACGGTPHGGYIGGKYWHEPGAFVGNTGGQRFQGLCSVFVTAAFSYSGTELIAVSAAESVNPRTTLPKACKRTFWLITGCYIVVLTLIGCLVPYDDDRLLNGSSSVDVAASPLVIAIENGRIKGLPSLMNAIILIAVLSVANSAVYACSRCAASMAQIGNLPKMFAYVDKKGRPLYAIIATLIFGLLSFIAASDKQNEVFTWLSALSGLSTLFCWFSINLSHIRFRYTMKKRNRSLEELPFVSMVGVWGSVYGCVVIFLVLIASFWTSLFPVGSSGADVTSFFEGYLSLPILIVCYVGHKLATRDWRLYVRAEDMDIDSGRRAIDIEVLKEEKRLEQEHLKSRPFYERFWHLWC